MNPSHRSACSSGAVSSSGLRARHTVRAPPPLMSAFPASKEPVSPTRYHYIRN
ncbi:hypothetical protein HYPSUDRAFT_38870, partial [Hypholoma sublateritium FD-334 SS-4]